LKQFEQPLRARQDKGEFWWELRACDYYDVFEEPKIVVQRIAYYSQFAFDDKSYYLNDKANVIPTDDLFVLAILNSRIAWWIVNRTFQHMKDEGLAVEVQFLKRLPVPVVTPSLRSEISLLARALIAAVASTAQEQTIAAIEIELNGLVEKAFMLTQSERDLMLSSLPPRDPVDAIQRKSLQPPGAASRARRWSLPKSPARTNDETETVRPVLHASDRLERGELR
jgi:TaqI-like C-terminal specificity domain